MTSSGSDFDWRVPLALSVPTQRSLALLQLFGASLALRVSSRRVKFISTLQVQPNAVQDWTLYLYVVVSGSLSRLNFLLIFRESPRFLFPSGRSVTNHCLASIEKIPELVGSVHKVRDTFFLIQSCAHSPSFPHVVLFCIRFCCWFTDCLALFFRELVEFRLQMQ